MILHVQVYVRIYDTNLSQSINTNGFVGGSNKMGFIISMTTNRCVGKFKKKNLSNIY